MASTLSERTSGLLLGALLVYVTAAGVWEASQRPFWYDEVFTVVLTRLPSFDATLDALADGADTPGPGYYWLQRLIVDLVPDEHVSLRLLSVLGLAATSLFLFLFVRRDLGVQAAFLAAILPLLSPLNHGYSVEARPYALVVALVAVAAVAWQRSESRWWTLVLGGSVLAAASIHYYAVFTLAPLAAAELAHCARSRQVRPLVWLCIVVGVLPVLLNWSLLIGLRDYYGEYYWSKPSFARAVGTFDYVLSTGVPGTGFGVAAAAGFALLAWAARLVRQTSQRNEEHVAPPVENIVLVMALMALPFLIVGVTKVMSGGYAYRYGLGVSVGMALGLTYAIHLVGPRARNAALLCAIAAWIAHEALFLVSGGAVGGNARGPVEAHQRLLEDADDDGMPIVVVNGLDFVPLVYYERDEPRRSRFVTLLDADAARSHRGTDSLELDLAKLRGYSSVRIEEVDDFLAEHDAFRILVTTNAADWWVDRLRDAGIAVELDAKTERSILFTARRRAAN